MTMLDLAATASDSSNSEAAFDLAEQFADYLDAPETMDRFELPYGNWPQSLAHGAAGIALLHIERAARGIGSWSRVREWIAIATRGELSCGANASLFYGVPALAFVLRTAGESLPGSYTRALRELDDITDAVIRRRLDAARARRLRGELPALAEFDTLRGLAGLGTLLMHRDPGCDLLGETLTYLVELTQPVREGDNVLPGWWTGSGPNGRTDPTFPGGHANTGLAHGIAGPLSFLSHALAQGVAVAGQAGAIQRMCSWLDLWRQSSAAGPWWPHWITRPELHSHRAAQPAPNRPSWCYGTAGLARAQQLAALALGDPFRQANAEEALIAALTDPAQLAETTDASLCHGYAGMLHIAARMAADALTPGISSLIPRLSSSVRETASNVARRDPALLEGAAGTALALYSLASPPATRWDQILLIG